MKIIRTLAILITMACSLQNASAGHHKTIDYNYLPVAAKNLIQKYFGRSKAVFVEKEGYFRTEYKVVMQDGKTIEFDQNGNWTEIYCAQDKLPLALYPVKVREYLKRNFARQNVIKIERDRHGYEVKLENGLEIKFDRNQNVRKVKR